MVTPCFKFSEGVNFIKFRETRFVANLMMGKRLLNLKEAVQSAFRNSNFVKYAEKSTWFDLHTLNQEDSVCTQFGLLENLKKIVGLLMPILVLLRLFDSDILCT